MRPNREKPDQASTMAPATLNSTSKSPRWSAIHWRTLTAAVVIQSVSRSTYGPSATDDEDALLQHVGQVGQGTAERSAAWAAPVEVTSPTPARCSKRPMPAAPWFRSGRSSVPDLPKIFTAAAARNVGFGTAAIGRPGNGTAPPAAAWRGPARWRRSRPGPCLPGAALGGPGDGDLHAADAHGQSAGIHPHRRAA